MNRYLLLILLSSWANVVPLSLQCETGNAYPEHVLSITRSLMDNADVAVLKTYKSESLNKCITDCCAEKYGSCTVASFRKVNDTDENCQHFNCRPVNKCNFLSSNTTDSFSFSSSSTTHDLVPSSHASKNDSLSKVATVTTTRPKLDKFSTNTRDHEVTKETIATYSEETFALKDDNTTIKPRKGVDEVTDHSFENVSRSGVKPRKGVSLDGLTNSNNSKSKVKPRKGVGPFQSQSTSSHAVTEESSMHGIVSTQNIVPNVTSTSSMYKDTVADDIVSALEKVFEDDSNTNHVKPSISSTYTTEITSQDMATEVVSLIPTSSNYVYTSTSTEKTSLILQSSLTINHVASSSVETPNLVTFTVAATETFKPFFQPSSSGPSLFEHSKLLFHETETVNDVKHIKNENDSKESENQRKYRSSMHIVLSLVFGLLVLFSVLGVIGKRIYDGWLRRHYRRMDFLIDGMYNGYG